MPECEICGRPIEVDWRFGKKKVGGVYLCSKECEREQQAIMEEKWSKEVLENEKRE